MNRTHTFLGAAILALATSPVFAGQWDNNLDLQQSILNDISAGGFVGTSFSSAKAERGSGDTYGWAVLDVQAGDIGRSAGAEKGQGDAYGSVLNDI